MRLHNLRDSIHIAIIGGNGFLGRSIIARLSAYHNLRIFSIDKREHGVLIETSTSKAIIQQINMDISIPGNIQTWLAGHPVDVLIFAAGYENPSSGVWNSSIDDLTALVGLNYTLNGLNRLPLEPGEKRPYFLYISSWAVYGEANNQISNTEECKEYPSNHVGMARLMGEDLVKRLCNKYSCPCGIVRPSEVYGKHNNKELGKENFWTGFVSYFVDRIVAKDQELELWKADAKIDLVHVNYFSKVILYLIEHQLEGIFNICSGETYSIRELANLVLRIYGNEASTSLVENHQISLDSMLLSPQKIHSLVPYEPPKYKLSEFLSSYIPIRRFEIGQNMAIEDILSEPLTVDTTSIEAKDAYEARKHRRRIAYTKIKEIAGPEFFKIKIGKLQERTKELLEHTPTLEEIEIGKKEQKRMDDMRRLIISDAKEKIHEDVAIKQPIEVITSKPKRQRKKKNAKC
jgi:nucleoside-diphosphate-sugar epimerase